MLVMGWKALLPESNLGWECECEPTEGCEASLTALRLVSGDVALAFARLVTFATWVDGLCPSAVASIARFLTGGDPAVPDSARSS